MYWKIESQKKFVIDQMQKALGSLAKPFADEIARNGNVSSTSVDPFVMANSAGQTYTLKESLNEIEKAVFPIQLAVGAYAQDNGNQVNLEKVNDWVAIGLFPEPMAIKEAASFQLGKTGTIVANLDKAVAGLACSIIFTPVISASGISWVRTTAGAATNADVIPTNAVACPEPVPEILAKWNLR
jgi:hypothetical protein